MRMPAPATPVGWNCQNSMSSSGMPARAAMPRPSPVLMKAFVDEGKMRAGAVGRAAAPLHRTLAEVLRMAAERTLVDGAVLVAVEGHAVVLELDHELGRHAAHELDRVLVAEVVGALDRVVHVPDPVVLAH